jgi:hypothetical protein
MTDKLRQGDRVRCEYGRTGVLNGVFAEVVAWVSWDDDRLGYESIENLSKVLRAAGASDCINACASAKRAMGGSW